MPASNSLETARIDPDAEGINRRSHPRVNEPPLVVRELGLVRDISMEGFPVQIQPALPVGDSCVIRDISLGGISVYLDMPIRNGEQFEMALSSGSGGRTRHFGAEVVWAGGRAAGLRWVGLSRDQQRWLKGLISEWQEPRPTVRLNRLLTAASFWRR